MSDGGEMQGLEIELNLLHRGMSHPGIHLTGDIA
jgi:hypothetical protein